MLGVIPYVVPRLTCLLPVYPHYVVFAYCLNPKLTLMRINVQLHKESFFVCFPHSFLFFSNFLLSLLLFIWCWWCLAKNCFLCSSGILSRRNWWPRRFLSWPLIFGAFHGPMTRFVSSVSIVTPSLLISPVPCLCLYLLLMPLTVIGQDLFYLFPPLQHRT